MLYLKFLGFVEGRGRGQDIPLLVHFIVTFMTCCHLNK